MGALDRAYSTYMDKSAKSKARAAKKLSLASVSTAIQGVAEQIAEQAGKLVNGSAEESNGHVVNGDIHEKEGIQAFDFVCLHR